MSPGSGKARTVYASWIRPLAALAAALGLAGTTLMDEPQPASAGTMIVVKDLDSVAKK